MVCIICSLHAMIRRICGTTVPYTAHVPLPVWSYCGMFVLQILSTARMTAQWINSRHSCRHLLQHQQQLPQQQPVSAPLPSWGSNSSSSSEARRQHLHQGRPTTDRAEAEASCALLACCPTWGSGRRRQSPPTSRDSKPLQKGVWSPHSSSARGTQVQGQPPTAPLLLRPGLVIPTWQRHGETRASGRQRHNQHGRLQRVDPTIPRGCCCS